MSKAQQQALQLAVEELQQLIEAHYPGTTFEIEQGADDPNVTNIIAIVDLDDPDEVMDMVIERLLTLQVEEALPIQVVPIRTPERIEQHWRQRANQQGWATPLSPVQP
jgi:hypothetical protein